MIGQPVKQHILVQIEVKQTHCPLKKSIVKAIYTDSIPQIPIVPSDLPFTFKSHQFLLKATFSIIIKKAQGQNVQVAGLHLKNQCFSHGKPSTWRILELEECHLAKVNTYYYKPKHKAGSIFCKDFLNYFPCNTHNRNDML